ncbi:MAG: type II toxin-antitoxin system HipA family toxin [Desulfobacteraceae bacterium]|nr:type II toxin-antitoxin system HipA family toxin [Desulfobacteraceae bacterium]
MNVFFGQIRIGSLSINSRRQFLFEYSRQWLESVEAFRISVSLPLQEGAFPHDTVKSFFSNLLPESAVRKLVSKQLGISDKNDFMLLKRIGGECAGAISILPEPEMPESPDQYQYLPLSDEQLTDIIAQIPRRPLLAGREGIRMSLAGAQEKLALFYKEPDFYIPMNGAPSNVILKPAMAHFQGSVENECFCMMLAGSVGLNVPPVSIVRRGTQKALVVERYDRRFDNGVLQRIHQEDFCQALGLSHELKYQADGGPGLKACFDLVRAYSANPIKDLQQLLEWVFFNVLIGNMDAHAKNLSFMYHGKQIRLAPFYDMMCTDIYEDLSQKLAMKIGGENRSEWIMERHWEKFAEEIKIGRAVLRKRLMAFCLRLISRIDTAHTYFAGQYQTGGLLDDVIARIKKQTEEMLKIISVR